MNRLSDCSPPDVRARIPRMRKTVVTWALLTVMALSGCIRNDLARSNLVTVEPPAHSEPPRWQIWLYNTYFYPTARPFVPAGEATNLDQHGEVPTGSFFVNRDIRSLTPRDIEYGPNSTLEVPGPIAVRKVKPHPTRPSFFGTDRDGRRYLFKLDQPGLPEMSTGAEAVATRLLWAIGYRVPANRICTVEGTGDPRLDGRRALASEFIPGTIKGPWKFRDAYRRREMRALKVASAWINNTDVSDHQTLVAWDRGVAYYYILDFDNALGAQTHGPKKPWHGWRYRWDTEEQGNALLTLGLYRLFVPYPYDPPAPLVSPAVGRFGPAVDPRLFKNEFPVYTFSAMTEADGVWMAGRLAQFTREQIQAAVRAGRYSNPADEEYLVKTLLARRDAICRAYGVDTPTSPHRDVSAE
jgi:hypothetical protein